MFDRDSLLEASKNLSQECSARADEIEKARCIPADLSQKIAEAGFYALGAPAYLGGLEAAPEISSQVFEILAQGDASCAWVAFIGTTASTSLASMSRVAATEVFSSPTTVVTGVFAPTGIAERVTGGFRVSGRWQWGSGSQNADWITGGCLLKENGEGLLDEAGKPRQHQIMMPAREIKFLDTWHVSGLRGTGSLDYEVKDLFVPEERVIGYLKESLAPTNALYAFPHFTFLALGIGAICMGIARASITDLVELAASKRRISSRKTIAEHPLSQMKLSQAEADMRSARLLYYSSIADAWETAVTGGEVSVVQRANIRLAVNNAVTKSVGVVDEMYALAGGSAVYESSRLQRQLRDIHVAKSHIMVAPSILETAGRLLFGLDTNVEMF